MNNASNVLVTGATGFIGKSLCNRLESLGYFILKSSSTDGDIADSGSLEKFSNQNIKHVFHLAGNTFVPKSWDNPHDFIKTNSLGTATVLEFCRKNNCTLTYVSAYIYGSDVVNPISEKYNPAPNNPYALSKQLAEELCLFYSNFYNLIINIVRPFNVYGPGQNSKFLIPTIIKQIKESNEVKVKDLSPKRDYIFIDDLVDGIIKTMDNKTSELFNLGTGKSYSVKEIIEMAIQESGKSINVISDDSVRINEISDTIADISKAKKMLNWEPKVSISQGIKQMF
ncbi:MAG: NAD(P)-dependent oxidoreductase [Nitrosopumilus sp.]|nr:NAD(P)-dependent oxidoreductase [Nitrosopumilus sp.]MBA3971069.1 NAD(P)-dependent oxidoreductase [Bacteroidota bacterium]